MKKIVSLLLFAAICAAIFTIPAGAIPAPVDVLDQDIAFMNTLNYQSPEIYYQPSDTAEPDVWLHEPMIDAYFVLDGINVFYYNFPSDGDYVFYIADSESRTEAMIYSDQNLLVRCYEGYKDKNGYDQTGCSVLATATPKDNAVFFIKENTEIVLSALFYKLNVPYGKAETVCHGKCEFFDDFTNFTHKNSFLLSMRESGANPLSLH